MLVSHEGVGVVKESPSLLRAVQLTAGRLPGMLELLPQVAGGRWLQWGRA